VRATDLNHAVALPPGLTVGDIGRAIDYIERELADLVDIYHEQRNVFSAIVGMYGVKALDSFSDWEKHKRSDTTRQRLPALRRRGSGASPGPNESLESKGSKRPWDLQSHHDDPGWYVIWRYLVDTTESIEPGKPVTIWRVDVDFLDTSDWIYAKSSAGAVGGGRTAILGVRNAAKRFQGKSVYQRQDIVLRYSKPTPRDREN